MLPPFSLPGKIEEVVLEARMVERSAGKYKKDENYINGMPEYTVEMKEHISVSAVSIVFNTGVFLSVSVKLVLLCAQLDESTVMKKAGVTSKGRSEFVHEITFQKLTPGSIIAFR